MIFFILSKNFDHLLLNKLKEKKSDNPNFKKNN